MRVDYENAMKIGDRWEYLTRTQIDKPTSVNDMRPAKPAMDQIITNDSHAWKMQVKSQWLIAMSYANVMMGGKETIDEHEMVMIRVVLTIFLPEEMMQGEMVPQKILLVNYFLH